jgi:hypothetical protein
MGEQRFAKKIATSPAGALRAPYNPSRGDRERNNGTAKRFRA